jgi:hypothetical protein
MRGAARRSTPWAGRLAGAAALLACASCVPPRASPLAGAPTTRPLPRTAVPPGHTRIRFRWNYTDPNLELAGDGQARIAAPDSARLDFVIDQGAGGGFALLFGDTLLAPTASSRAIHHYLPAGPMLWAALGRVAVPAAPDTVIRLDGDTLRADIGTRTGKALKVAWRIAFVGTRFLTLERVSGGRVRERVTRAGPEGPGDIIYERLGATRTLTLTKVHSDSVAAFDPAIWQRRR